MNLNKPFRGADAIAAGLTSRRRLGGPSFLRLGRDVYVAAGAVLGETDRIVAAALALPGAVVGGYAAATVLDAPCAPRAAPVDLIVGSRHLDPRAGVVLHQDVLTDEEIVRVEGLAVTGPLRTAFDLARRLDHVDAVVALDALAHRWRFEPSEVLDYPSARVNPRGCRSLADVVADADPRAESPPETRTRLVLKATPGLPQPTPQVVVRDGSGAFVARVDFGWPELRVALEYQGDDHRTDRRRWARDITRTAALLAVGWVVLPVTAFDLFVDPRGLIRRLWSALARRARELGLAGR